MSLSVPGDRAAERSNPSPIRFGDFELDIRAHELKRNGDKIRLADQPFHILMQLLEHPGEVVTREELRQRLWPADTFVAFDLSLNSAVHKLREALSDSADHPAYIETLPRRGYRFIGSVQPPVAAPAQASLEPTPDRAADAPAPPRSKRMNVVVTIAGIVAIAGVVGWIAWPRRATPQTKAENDPDAYALYMRGIAATGNLNYEGFRLAATYFEQAVAKDPNFAQAHGYLALARAQFLFGSPLAPNEILPQVEAAANRALELDPNTAEAHRALAMSRRVYRDFDASDLHAELARKAAPKSAEAVNPTVQMYLRERRLPEALAAARHAYDLDPLSVNAILGVARVLRIAGQPQRAADELRHALQLQPKRPNLLFQLGATYVLMGDLTSGVRELKNAVTASTQRNVRFLAYLGYAHARQGHKTEARQILQELVMLREHQYVSSFGIAMVEEALGDFDAARMDMNRAFDDHALEFSQLDVYPPILVLHSDHRYTELIAR